MFLMQPPCTAVAMGVHAPHGNDPVVECIVHDIRGIRFGMIFDVARQVALSMPGLDNADDFLLDLNLIMPSSKETMEADELSRKDSGVDE